MKATELKKMTAPELQKELESLRREHFNLRMQLGTGQLTRTHMLKDVRRNIARVKTVMQEKSVGKSHEE